MKFDEHRIMNFFRPKHGEIVEFDTTTGEYLSWVSSLIRKYRIRKFKEEKINPEKRFVVGYTKQYRDKDGNRPWIQGIGTFFHYVGGEGAKSHEVSDHNDLDFLFIRRPVGGVVVVVIILMMGGIMAAYDGIRGWLR